MLYFSPLPPSCSRVGFGVFCGVREFLVFLASSARPACASSFCFHSAVRLRSILFLPLWLTGQSSRPAFGGRLTFFRFARLACNLIKPDIAAQRWRPAIEHKNSF